MRLDAIAVAAGVRLEALGTVGSTNREARLRARRGEGAPLWITAVAQSEGRGRMARSWSSPPGNLYASLLLREPSSFPRAPELAFVTALALRDAIGAEAPVLLRQLALKWPNDVLVGGKKCAGILIEGDVGADQSVTVIIGVGVNCASHPEDVAFPAADLADCGAALAPEQLFRRLSATMCTRIAQWDRGRGFSDTRGDWINAAHGIGDAVTVRNGSGEKHGRFVGLDPAGRLVLELCDGAIEKIAAGDVFPFEFRGDRSVPGRTD